MNTESMIFRVDNILKTYVTLVRSIIGEDASYFLIGYGLKSHFNERVEESFSNLKLVMQQQSVKC